jgi:tRNA uridine 5-carbamoylmethylation protein Kti12
LNDFHKFQLFLGQRYELYTIAKNNRTTFCILFCDAESSVSDWLNGQREDGYNSDVLEDLRSRFERPKPRMKGDDPTYELNIGKEGDAGDSQTPRNIELPIDELYELLVKGKNLKQNKSTTPFKFC